MADYNLKAIITGDSSGYEASVKKAKQASESLSSTIHQVSKLMKTAFSVVGISTSISAIKSFGTECVKSAESANKSLNILNNTLKVTGASAWTTSEDLVKMSEEIAYSTNYTVGEIQDMQSVLLGFKNITGDTFREASDAITDMATVMGMDLKSAVQTVGKALDDPIKGLDSLRRQGFAFTEEQKEMLATLVENGKQLEAQKIILDELNTTYGGASKSAQSSFDKQKDAVIEFKEAVGNQLLPVLNAYAETSATMFEGLTDKIKTIDFAQIASDIEYVVDVSKAYFKVFYDNAKSLFNSLYTTFEGAELNFTSFKDTIYNVLNDVYKQIQISFGFINALIKGDWKLAWEYAKLYVLDICKKILDGLDELLKKMPNLVNGAIKGLNKYYEAQDKVLIEWLHLPEKYFKAPRLGTYNGTDYIDTSKLQSQIDEATKAIESATGKCVAIDLVGLEKIEENKAKYQNKAEEGQVQFTNATEVEVKKRVKVEEKEEKNKFATMIEYAKQYARQIASVFKNIVSNVKNIFSKAGNIFMKIIEFNPDEALDNLLKFEDAILTFFVETLPKLPAFFKSAMQSIIVLIDTVLNVLDFDVITETLSDILQSIITAVSNWVGSGGWKKLLDAFLKLQQMIENVIADNLPAIVDTIVAMLPDLIDMLIASIVSASKTLARIAKPIIKLVIELIKAIIEVITSDEVMEAGLDAMMALTEAIFDDLLPAIIKLIPNLIVKVIAQVIKNFPKIVKSIIQGLIKSFATLNWAQVVVDCFMGFIDAFKDLFGIHSPSTLFESFGQYMIEGLILGIQGMADALNSVLQPIYNLVVNIFGQIGNIITSSISASFSGLTSLLGGINSGIAQITNSVANLINSLTNLISTANQAVSALNPLSGGSSGGGGYGAHSTGSTAGDIAVDLFVPGGFLRHFFANGSQNVPKGLSIVGEAGPELVKFRGGEQVLNNRNTNKALENMGGKTNNFNVTFNNLQDTTAFNMMQQLKAYNRQMAINGVI